MAGDGRAVGDKKPRHKLPKGAVLGQKFEEDVSLLLVLLSGPLEITAYFTCFAARPMASIEATGVLPGLHACIQRRRQETKASRQGDYRSRHAGQRRYIEQRRRSEDWQERKEEGRTLSWQA
jgi:hypothetical protein